MANVTLTSLRDARRTDLRKQTLENPVWLTSGEFTFEDYGSGKGALLFTFPTKPTPDNINPYSSYAPASDLGLWGKKFVIHDAAVEIIQGFNGTSPVIDVTLGTIANDVATAITYDDSTEQGNIVASATITEGTAGTYASATAPRAIITCADSSVPAIVARVTTSSGTPSTGRARVHILVSRIPVG